MDYMLEIYSEEIPSRMQKKASFDLERMFSEKLVENEINFKSISSFSTPRRLTLVVENLKKIVNEEIKTIKGPSVDAPSKALEGFKKKYLIDDKDLFIKKIGKKNYYFLTIRKLKVSIDEIISKIVSKTIMNFPWEKSMRWANGDLKWVRPIHSILSIKYDKEICEIIDIDIDDIYVGKETFGHPFLNNEKIKVSSFSEYQEKLKKAKVIIDHTERKKIIYENLKSISYSHNLELIEDEKLLDEVTGLVEWPVLLKGDVKKSFEILPKEVLQISMRENQKFFSLFSKKENRISAFVTVANNDAFDNGKKILEGNTKVLNARLSDALFFWEKDLFSINESGFIKFSDNLKNITFHNQLGTMEERVIRIYQISKKIAKKFEINEDDVKNASFLCKADLVSLMVKEFPKLQGIMGYYYSLKSGFSNEVSLTCKDHYSPLGPYDDVPSNKLVICIALADKIDLLSSFWSINLKPTGSKDPYGLRRAALGLIRILIQNKLDFSLKDLFKYSGLKEKNKSLESFFYDRTVVYFKSLNFKHDLIDACLSKGVFDYNLSKMYDEISLLQDYLNTDKGKDLIYVYKRSIKILEQEEKKENIEYGLDPEEKFLVNAHEKKLFQKLVFIKKKYHYRFEDIDLMDYLNSLSKLKVYVDLFFDNNQINSNNSFERRNRLCLLNQVRFLTNKIANFSKLEGE